MTTRSRSLILRLTGAAALAVAALVISAGPLLADALDDRIAEVKKLAKAKEEKAVIVALNELGDNPDKRVNKLLFALTKSKSDKIAKIALKRAAQRRDPSLHKKMKSLVSDKKLAKKRPQYYAAVLEAAAEYRDPKLLDPLEKMVKKYLPTNPTFSTRAIRAYGSVKEKDVIPELLKWLDQTGSTAAGSGGGGGGVSKETKDNYKKASVAILETLEELTGLDIGDAGTWKKWWYENEKTFEFPSGDVVEQDPATMLEHVDHAYKFTVKKPDAPALKEEEKAGWLFVEPTTKGMRCFLKYQDETGLDFVWVEYRILNTTKKPQKSPKELVTWWVKDWEENHFDDLARGPDVEEVKIRGREYLMAVAKGQSGGRSRGWGSVERRVYVTQQEHMLIYAALTVRLGAEDDIKKAAIAAAEGMLFK